MAWAWSAVGITILWVVLHSADYLLTIAAARMYARGDLRSRIDVGGRSLELNPVFQRAVNRGAWVSRRFLLSLIVVGLLILAVFTAFEALPPGQLGPLASAPELFAGVLVVTRVAVIGGHLQNLALFRQRTLHPLRRTGLLAILLVLGLGGLVVSVKIGGGGDLHNLDAYLILLALTGGYLFFGRAEPESEQSFSNHTNPANLRTLLIALALAIPIGMALQTGETVFTWDRAKVERVFSLTREQIEAAARGKPVLFISQRQLLALKMIDAPLMPEYEQDALMEMVMSHNSAYLERFQADLRAQKYGMIVAEPQIVHYYGKTNYFGEENDLWVKQVSIPLLCYYEPYMQPGLLGMTLYIPRETPCQ